MNQQLLPQDVLISQFKAFYLDLQQSNIVDMQHIYANDIVFKDPIHQVRGIDHVMSYMQSSINNTTQCRFEFLDEIISEHSAFIKWHMHYQHPKLGNMPQTLLGMTHLLFDDKITFHEDTYDLGAMVYEHIPVLGSATRYVKRKLGHY